MKCNKCNQEHRCQKCGYWFATLDGIPGDGRSDCSLCLECWHESQAPLLGACPCGRPIRTLGPGMVRCDVLVAFNSTLLAV